MIGAGQWPSVTHLEGQADTDQEEVGRGQGGEEHVGRALTDLVKKVSNVIIVTLQGQSGQFKNAQTCIMRGKKCGKYVRSSSSS